MFYRIEEYDGLGQRAYTVAWSETETKEQVERLGGVWDPKGGSVHFDEYNAGTDHSPSWRHSTLEWAPIE